MDSLYSGCLLLLLVIAVLMVGLVGVYLMARTAFETCIQQGHTIAALKRRIREMYGQDVSSEIATVEVEELLAAGYTPMPIEGSLTCRACCWTAPGCGLAMTPSEAIVHLRGGFHAVR